MEADKACCGCHHITFDPEKMGNGMMRERWRCPDCGTVFAKEVMLPANATERRKALLCNMATECWTSAELAFGTYEEAAAEALRIEAAVLKQMEEQFESGK